MALCGDVAEILAASMTKGRGRRTAKERTDALMQSAPDDLYEALMSRLTPEQQQNAMQRAEVLSRPLHPNCYRAPPADAGTPAARKKTPQPTPAPPAASRARSSRDDVRSGVPLAAVLLIAFAALVIGAGSLFLLVRLGLVSMP